MALDLPIGGLMLGALGCYLLVQKLRSRSRRRGTDSNDCSSGDGSWGGADSLPAVDSCTSGDSGGGCDGGGDGGGGD